MFYSEKEHIDTKFGGGEPLFNGEFSEVIPSEKQIEIFKQNIATNFVIPLIENLTTAIEKFANKLLGLYPNKRVVHLAKYCKKKRTQKKNINRINKWLQGG